MSLTLRGVKGSPLTYVEADANFSGLADGSLIPGGTAGLASPLDGLGDALVAVKRTSTGAIATSLHNWIEGQAPNLKADFGAVGDGVTNDYAAIIAAAAVGAEVPPGNYAFSTPIVSSGKFVLFSKYGFPEVQGNSPQSSRPLVSFTWTGSDAATPITLDTTGASQVVFKDIAVFVNKTFSGTCLKIRGADSTAEANRADVDISPALYRTPLDTGVTYAPGDSTSIAVTIDCVNDANPRTAYGWRFPNIYAFNFNTLLKINVSGTGSWFNTNFFGNIKGYQVYRWLDAQATAGSGCTISGNIFQSTTIQPGTDSASAFAAGCTRFNYQVTANVFLGLYLHDIPDADKLTITNATAGALNAFFGGNLPYTVSAVNYASLDAIISFPDYFKFSRNNSTKFQIDTDGAKFGGDTAAINGLSKFEGSTFTPALTFNNTSVGMTGTFLGSYVVIGKAVIAYIDITLTAKGSSTGTARITSLPKTSGGTNTAGGGHAYYHESMTLTTASVPSLDVAPANTVGTLRKSTSAATSVNMADTDFTDTSKLRMKIFYFTA